MRPLYFKLLGPHSKQAVFLATINVTCFLWVWRPCDECAHSHSVKIDHYSFGDFRPPKEGTFRRVPRGRWSLICAALSHQYTFTLFVLVNQGPLGFALSGKIFRCLVPSEQMIMNPVLMHFSTQRVCFWTAPDTESRSRCAWLTWVCRWTRTLQSRMSPPTAGEWPASWAASENLTNGRGQRFVASRCCCSV